MGAVPPPCPECPGGGGEAAGTGAGTGVGDGVGVGGEYGWRMGAGTKEV